MLNLIKMNAMIRTINRRISTVLEAQYNRLRKKKDKFISFQ